MIFLSLLHRKQKQGTRKIHQHSILKKEEIKANLEFLKDSPKRHRICFYVITIYRARETKILAYCHLHSLPDINQIGHYQPTKGTSEKKIFSLSKGFQKIFSGKIANLNDQKIFFFRGYPYFDPSKCGFSKNEQPALPMTLFFIADSFSTLKITRHTTGAKGNKFLQVIASFR